MDYSKALALLLLVVPFTTKAEDCGCKPVPTTLSAYQFANAVFSGTVERVSDLKPIKGIPITPGEVQEIVFEVDRVWKGPQQFRITLTRVNSVDRVCNYPFKKGETYLVFADKTSSDVYRKKYVAPGKEILDATVCGRTKLLSEANSDLAALGGGKIPTD